MLPRVLALAPAVALALGGGLHLWGAPHASQAVLAAGTLCVLGALIWTAGRSLRRGEIGLDVVAALAMAGALAGGEFLAGAVVALMFAGGQALESFAQGSAEREMTALLGRVARTALRRRRDRVETVAIEDIGPGDRLLIRAGEALPVDGVVVSPSATLDEAALTGEPLPVRHAVGDAVPSGVTNAGDAFDLEAIHRAADSTYAGIVRLVVAARTSKAPMARLADRYALGFLAVTLILSGGAWWLSDDWHRALAVLVIATPCPLILAVPVAIVSGLSHCARRGVLVKSAGALEAMAGAKTLLIDKTGTLTVGRPDLQSIVAIGGMAHPDILRMAGSLAQASQHAVSEALVRAARAAGHELTLPNDVEETPGEGLTGRIDGHLVVLGQPQFVAQRTSACVAPVPLDGTLVVAVGIDGAHTADILLADDLRPDAREALQAFHSCGIERIVLVTGDRVEVAEAIAQDLPIDRLVGNRTPADKVEVVREELAHGPVIMIGDGINDAPALALADVGVALGARGAAAAAEAADAVVLVDRLDRIAEAVGIARRTRSIAFQSVFVGLGLSFAGMVAAALGALPLLAGALTQEIIDVAVVLNALRCLGPIGRRDPGSEDLGVAAAAPDLMSQGVPLR